MLLTICATDGIDMVNEEYVSQLQKLNTECCLAHAIQNVNINTVDPQLKLTLVVMKRILSRITQTAQDFICLLMQQRFSEQEQ